MFITPDAMAERFCHGYTQFHLDLYGRGDVEDIIRPITELGLDEVVNITTVGRRRSNCDDNCVNTTSSCSPTWSR